jgi:hypothetical protein
VTTTQDYFLLYILNHYSIDLWKREIEALMRANGLVSFIVHPDYLIEEERSRKSYTALLDYLVALRSEHALWMALPLDVNKWWRKRSQMRLIAAPDGWTILGEGSEQARVAYARLEGDRISYRIDATNPVAARLDDNE